VSSSYRASGDNEPQEKLKWSFSCAVDKSDYLRQSKDFKTIEGWYKQTKKTSDSISSPSIVLNEMVDELVKQTYPRYTNSIIDKIDNKTQFIGGSSGADFDIGIVSMKPYVEFIKIVNGDPMPPFKFTFQLDIDTRISIIKTLNTSVSYIEIRKLGIDLKIWLLQIPYLHLSPPIKLTTKTFDIHNIRIPSRGNGETQNASLFPRRD
jgi:hypothetical protein